jgi:parallel beta-helix repeat protein
MLRVAHLTVLIVTLLFATAAPEALANHVQCGDVITQDTKLDSDLVNCPSDGIVIGAGNITLDLGGHTIDGDNSQNIEPCKVAILNGPYSRSTCHSSTAAGHDDVTVRNGAIRDFDTGVLVSEASRNRLRGLTISASHFAAVIVTVSEETSIERNLLKDNWSIGGVLNFDRARRVSIVGNVVSGNAHNGTESDGIYDSRIERNTFVGNQAGMHLHGVRNSLIAHNLAAGNGTGIELSDGVSDNLVFKNRVVDNRYIGIMTQEGVHRNRIERNFVADNGSIPTEDSSGIIVFGDGDNEQIVNNVLLRNHQGIVVTPDSLQNVVEGNLVSGSARDGIVLRDFDGSRHGGNRVASNTLTRNGLNGLLAAGNQNLIEGNRAIGNGHYGIDTSGIGNHVRSNVVLRNGIAGMVMTAGTDNQFTSNVVSNNHGDGIYMDELNASGNVIDRNIVTGNLGTGIGLFEHADQMLVTGNFLWNNGEAGILVGDAGSSRLVDNFVVGNDLGIWLHGSYGMVLQRNETNRNARDGILAEAYGSEEPPGGSAYFELTENQASRNGDDGIDVENADATLTANTANRNSDLGIEAVPGVKDGGGNRAFGNGNPLQCLNVTCR